MKCSIVVKRKFPLICLILTSCMVGPNYKEPVKPIAEHWAKKDRTVTEKPMCQLEWWKVFHDPNLTFLINAGYQHNLSLQAAGSRVLQARAKLAQTVGSLYPQQQVVTGNLQYYRIGGGYLENVLPSNFYTDSLGLSANWEIDFWGKYRRAIQSSDASFLSSFAAYDHALVSLTGDIASVYIRIRTTQALIKVTKSNIALQKMSLRLTQSRFDAGEVSLLDVEQAKTELSETEARLPVFVSELQTQKDLLAVLLGTIPNNMDKLLSVRYGIPQAPQKIAIGIPREALARRPDIQQARLEAVAQSAAIGATKANLYPALSLTGTFAFSANTMNNSSLADLFNWNNVSVVAGPALNWPVLNYGQITNAVRGQDAIFQQALLNYINTVLKAQQEVQDNITRYIEAKKAQNYLTKAVRSAIKATQLTLVRYKEGETDYTTVLYAEQQQLRVQTSLVNAQGETPLAMVALYRALGGGWQMRKGNDIVPDYIKLEMMARTDWGNLMVPPNHQPPKTCMQKIKQIFLPAW